MYSCVRVGDNGGRQENGRAGRKFNDQLAFPKYQVAAYSRVEVTEGGHRAQPKGQVRKILVLPTGGTWSKVERSSCEYAGREQPFELRVPFIKLRKVFDVVLI